MLRDLYWTATFHIVKAVRPMDDAFGVRVAVCGLVAGTVVSTVWYMRRGR